MYGHSPSLATLWQRAYNWLTSEGGSAGVIFGPLEEHLWTGCRVNSCLRAVDQRKEKSYMSLSFPSPVSYGSKLSHREISHIYFQNARPSDLGILSRAPLKWVMSHFNVVCDKSEIPWFHWLTSSAELANGKGSIVPWQVNCWPSEMVAHYRRWKQTIEVLYHGQQERNTLRKREYSRMCLLLTRESQRSFDWIE